MSKKELSDKMRLKRLELELADTSEQRKKIQNALTILQHQTGIEDLKLKIQKIRDSN